MGQMGSDWSHVFRPTLDAYQPYIFAITPLVFGHVVIPPLSYFVGARLHPSSQLCHLFDACYRHITPQAFLSLDNVLKLTLDPHRDKCAERSLAWFTHMFVHGDYQHLLMNLQGLLSTAFPVYSALGAVPMYVIFLLGGSLSDFPSSLHEMNVGYIPGTGMLPQFVRRGIFSFFRMFQREVHCGSSGGIFALIGGSSVLQCFKLCGVLVDCHRCGINALKTIRTNRLSAPSRLSKPALNSRVLPSCSHYYVERCKIYLSHAFRKLFSPEMFLLSATIANHYFTIMSEVNYLTSEAPTSVNYAAHVQGFLVGGVVTLSYLIVS